MKIERTKYNLENLTEDKPIVSDITDVPEVPDDIQSVNPIEEDQAIEIANRHPTTKEITNLTADEKVIALASDIDENTLDSNKVDAIAKTLDMLPGDSTLSEIIEVNKEAYEVLKVTPIEVSESDIANHPLQATEIYLNEKQVLNNKANEQTWGTIKEDCNNIAKLIDAALESIKAKEELKGKSIENIKNGEVTNSSYDFTYALPTIGALRYFLNPMENNGPLVDFINLLEDIANTPSPKIDSRDLNLIKNIDLLDTDSFNKVTDHIRTSIASDPLNVLIQTKVKNKPNTAIFTLFSRLTGGTVVEVLRESTREDVTVTENYKEFVINTSNVDMDGLKNNLIDAIGNFETKFKNTFLLLKTNYSNLAETLQPLVMPNSNTNSRTTETLAAIRYYYIELVKNRIVDKLNAYQMLLEIGLKIFKAQKGNNNANVSA